MTEASPIVSHRVTSWVEASFVGWHDAPFAQRLHAHWWRVRLHYRRNPVDDGRKILADLRQALAQLHQQGLADTLGMNATNEGIALWLVTALAPLDPVKIEVWRDADHLGAILEVLP